MTADDMSFEFTNNFWNEDLADNSGFEKVCEQLQNGKRICKGIADFIKIRITTEEDYARQLTKMVRHHGVQVDGSLGQSWQSLCMTTEQSATAHFKMSESMGEIHNQILQHLKERKQTQEPVEANIRKLQANKKAAFDKVKKAQGDYYRRCEAIESYEYQVRAARADKNRQKDVPKHEKNVNKAQHAMIEMKRIYQTQLDALDKVRRKWESENESALLVFQRLEEQRISFTRQLLWQYSNLISISSVEVDKYQQQLRAILEECSVSGDLSAFVAAKKTGAIRPDAVKFQEHPSLQLKNSIKKSDSAKKSTTEQSVKLPIKRSKDETPHKEEEVTKRASKVSKDEEEDTKRHSTKAKEEEKEENAAQEMKNKEESVSQEEVVKPPRKSKGKEENAESYIMVPEERRGHKFSKARSEEIRKSLKDEFPSIRGSTVDDSDLSIGTLELLPDGTIIKKSLEEVEQKKKKKRKSLRSGIESPISDENHGEPINAEQSEKHPDKHLEIEKHSKHKEEPINQSNVDKAIREEPIKEEIRSDVKETKESESSPAAEAPPPVPPRPDEFDAQVSSVHSKSLVRQEHVEEKPKVPSTPPPSEDDDDKSLSHSPLKTEATRYSIFKTLTLHATTTTTASSSTTSATVGTNGSAQRETSGYEEDDEASSEEVKKALDQSFKEVLGEAK